MKKEKKAIVKNSKYYYKKAELGKWIYIKTLTTMAIGLAGGLSFYYAHKNEPDEKFINLKNESGYSNYIQEDLEILEMQYKNGEISKDFYKASKEEMDIFKFEYYLKNKSDPYYLAEYEEIKKQDNKIIGITFGLTTSPIIAVGAYEISKMIYCLNKASKLKKEEQEENILA